MTATVAILALSVALAALALVGAAGVAAMKRADRTADEREARALSDGRRDAALSALDVAIEELTEAHARIAVLEEANHASAVPVPGAGRVGVLSALRRVRDRLAAPAAAGGDPDGAELPDAAPASTPE